MLSALVLNGSVLLSKTSVTGYCHWKIKFNFEIFRSFLINVSCRDRFARAHKKVFPVPVYLVVD